MKKQKHTVEIKNYVFALKGVENAYLGKTSTQASLKEAVYFDKLPYDFLQARAVLYDYHSDSPVSYWDYEVKEITVKLVEAHYERPKRKNRKIL